MLKCEKVREKGSCLLCEEFLECTRTEYQRGRYSLVLERYERVKEEREKALSGTLLNDIRKY